MRYMLLIYTSENEGATEEDLQRTAAAHAEIWRDAERLGVFVAAAPLHSPRAATTVRQEGERVVMLDGPFAETKEQLAGYYILDCEDLDEAIGWAARIPTQCGGAKGCVEVRPIRTASESMSSAEEVTRTNG